MRYIEKMIVPSGTKVKTGDPLILCVNQDLIAQKKELEATLKEYELRQNLAETRDRMEARILND